MQNLRTDIENLPMDGRPVIIGTAAGEIFISRYVTPTKQNPNGRWPGLASTGWPVAWGPLPSHPYYPQCKVLISGEIGRCKA